MEWSDLTESERHAMVYPYHLDDRMTEHYKIFVNLEAVNKIIVKFIEIRSAIENQHYSMVEIEKLRRICSSFKDWDGHHYFIYLILRIIDFLSEKLKEKTKPRCQKCGKELSLWKVGNPIEYFELYCYSCKENQFKISYDDIVQLIYKKYEEAN